jgi:DNA invertase Pin-like site-specific DNA recombinase
VTGQKRSLVVDPGPAGANGDRPGPKPSTKTLAADQADTTGFGPPPEWSGYQLGYARVSTVDQHPELQLDALQRAGCRRVFTDHASGARQDRPELDALLEQLRPGDTLVVWKLDRLGRSLKHLLEVVGELERRGVAFHSLSEALDTSTPAGRLLFHIMAALAEFERDLLRERTRAGLEAARARGRTGGRPRHNDAGQVTRARELLTAGGLSLDEVAGAVGMARTTLSRRLREESQ